MCALIRGSLCGSEIACIHVCVCMCLPLLPTGLRKKTVAPGAGGLDDHMRNPGGTDLFGTSDAIVKHVLEVGACREKQASTQLLLESTFFSLVPSPSHPSFCPRFFLPGCEIKAGVGRTGNEATHLMVQNKIYDMANK